jgi:hypothetical protein
VAEEQREHPSLSPETDQGSRFPELEELQREVERRIRDNRRFLERFMDENFVDEEEGENFEEL